LVLAGCFARLGAAVKFLMANLVARVVVEGVVQLPVSEGVLLEVPGTAPPGVFSVVAAAALPMLPLLCKLAVSAASSSNTSSPKGATK